MGVGSLEITAPIPNHNHNHNYNHNHTCPRTPKGLFANDAFGACAGGAFGAFAAGAGAGGYGNQGGYGGFGAFAGAGAGGAGGKCVCSTAAGHHAFSQIPCLPYPNTAP